MDNKSNFNNQLINKKKYQEKTLHITSDFI